MVDFAKLRRRAELRKYAHPGRGVTPLEHYDDPCMVDDAEEKRVVECRAQLPKRLPGPTGLSEEDDALVFMALRFNPNARVCTNCEEYYELVDMIDYCPRCQRGLDLIGAKMTRYKDT